MDDLCFGNVGDGVALGHDVMRPGQVFQAGQGLIVRIFLPQAAPDGGVGIVAEGVRLARLRVVGIPGGEDLVLRELGDGVAALFAVGQGNGSRPRHLWRCQRR